MAWRMLATTSAEIVGNHCRFSAVQLYSTSLLGRIPMGLAVARRSSVCLSIHADLSMRDEARNRSQGLEHDEYDEGVDDDFDDLETRGQTERAVVDNGDYESDFWDDVDHPEATRLADTLAKLKMSQVSSKVVPEIKKWIRQGNVVNKNTFVYVMRSLRKRNRLQHAVKLSDWLAQSKIVPLDTKDTVRRIDLYARAGRMYRAESIFRKMPEQDRSEAAYNAILLAYVKDKSLRRAERIFETLKTNNMISSPYAFNLMASLYRRLGMEEKVLKLVDEANIFDIRPDVCFNNNLLSASYAVEGIHTAEEIFDRIRAQRQKKHITTYVAMAGCYISEDMKDKAEDVLNQIERLMETGQFPKLRTSYNVLITMFATLKKPDRLMKAWNDMLQLGEPTSQDYICTIKALGKLGDISKVEDMFLEAEAKGKLRSSPIFNAMLYVYSQLQLVQRAEALVERMKQQLYIPLDPWCYYHLITLYISLEDLEKAISVLQESLDEGKRGPRRQPLPSSISTILNYLANKGDVERAEQVMRDWKNAGYSLPVGAYNKLLRVYVNAERPVDGFVERMLADRKRPNAQTERLFNELKSKLRTKVTSEVGSSQA